MAQGHGLVYGKAGRHDPVRRFVTTRFWQRVRAGGRCLALSGGILVGFAALGYVVDRWLGTSPWFTLAGLVLGIAAAVLMTVSRVRRFL